MVYNNNNNMDGNSGLCLPRYYRLCAIGIKNLQQCMYAW